jgi:hypothetical protein
MKRRAARAREWFCAMAPSADSVAPTAKSSATKSPATKSPAVKSPKPRAPTRAALVKRIWSAAEAQVSDIERRLALLDQEPAERERDARMLAVLVKTLHELVALDEARSGSVKRTEPNDDDLVPRDIDEFRRELARKIDAIIASRTSASSGEAG